MLLVQHAGVRSSQTGEQRVHQFLSLETRVNSYMQFDEMVQQIGGLPCGYVFGGSGPAVRSSFLKNCMSYIQSERMYAVNTSVSCANHNLGPLLLTKI